jgi:hypothetical protein
VVVAKEQVMPQQTVVATQTIHYISPDNLGNETLVVAVVVEHTPHIRIPTQVVAVQGS